MESRAFPRMSGLRADMLWAACLRTDRREAFFRVSAGGREHSSLPERRRRRVRRKHHRRRSVSGCRAVRGSENGFFRIRARTSEKILLQGKPFSGRGFVGGTDTAFAKRNDGSSASGVLQGCRPQGVSDVRVPLRRRAQSVGRPFAFCRRMNAGRGRKRRPRCAAVRHGSCGHERLCFRLRRKITHACFCACF